jgi:Enoyl-(Acyl carrier protein) reductase
MQTGIHAGHPALKRMAQPDDIGAAIVFLASDEARWITGDTLRVDGGSGSPLLAGSVSIGMISYISTNEHGQPCVSTSAADS